MSRSVLALGILGCGMIGEAFARAAAQTAGVEVVALCSRSGHSLQRVLEQTPRAGTHTCREDFLAHPRLEAVVVCTPHTRHVDDAVATIKRGKHVLIEKPIATTHADLDRLERVAAAHPLSVACALPHDSYPYLADLRRLSEEEDIGRITGFESVLDVPGPPRSNWYYSSEAGGGASLDTLPYALCRLLAYAGSNVTASVGVLTRLIRERACLDGGRVTPQVDDNATLVLTFAEGQHALVRSSWCVSTPRDYLRVFGRRGDLELNCMTGRILVRTPNVPSRELMTEAIDDDEALKLRVFTDAVTRRDSNLARVAYSMRLVLSALEGRRDLPVPAGIFGSGDALDGLRMGTGPI